MAMNKLIVLLVAVAVLALAATPAAACRIGGDHILFEQRPTPTGAEWMDVIFVHFTDRGRVFEHFKAHHPRQNEARPLIGVAQLEGYGVQVPVYARVTSCTHGFFGRPVPPHIGDFYIVGRWTLLPDGARAFMAGGLSWTQYGPAADPSRGAWHF